MDDFEAAKDVLTTDVLGLCKRYLPKGQIRGVWWLASVPWRVDKNPSLGVHLASGRWKDFARPEDRGDILDLISKISGRTTLEIVKETLNK